jgi:putative hydrolase of the HAD superfamily
VALRAVLFDLYGTLVHGGDPARRDEMTREVGRALGVDPEAMAEAMRETYDQRARGLLGDLPSTLRTLARRVGGDPDDDAVAAACELRVEHWRELLHPAKETLAALDRLRAAGLKLGLVSDCSIETPLVWEQTELAPRFDTAAFSSVIGVRKPNPDIYRAAYEPLGVAPQECLFVGDGGSRELSGAAALGMQALRLESDRTGQVDPDLDWAGGSIATLDEVWPRS